MSEKTKSDSGIGPSIAHDIEKLVDYSSGSIVSRTISKSKSGTITLFSFDVGEELSEHSAPYDAFVQVVDGEVVLVIGGERVTASKGEIVLMPANIPHAVVAEKRFKMILTMIKDKKN